MAETKNTAFLAAAPEPPDPLVGQLLQSKYRIVRKLGEGGMGDVYEAENELIGKRVAIKFLHEEYAADAEVVARFKQEARAATAVGNEHIIDVLDLGKLADGTPFIVMEMLKGIEFGDLIANDGPLPVDRAVRIVRQACGALAAAHHKGIVHRDMKPENIFLTERTGNAEFVKVLDFGISKVRPDIGQMRTTATRTGVAMGTPHYMSPEQAQGLRDTDHRTDIYALGVILYEALCKTVPFAGDSIALVLAQILKDEPGPMRTHRPELPAELDSIVMRTLAKDPNERFQTAAQLSDALLPFATKRIATAAPATESPPPQSTQMLVNELKRKNRTPLLGGLALVFIAAAVAVWFLGLKRWSTDGTKAIAHHGDEETAAKVVETPTPAKIPEVRVQIQVTPADAFIYVNGARFPNPMDAPRPRSLEPARIVIERPGYKPREEVAIFDRDQVLTFALAPLRKPEATPPETTETKPTRRDRRRRHSETRKAHRSSARVASKPETKPPVESGAKVVPKPKPKTDGIYHGRSGKLREDF